MSNSTPIPEHLAARMPQHQQPAAHEQPLEAPEQGGGEALIAFALALNAIENIAKTQTADTGKYTYRYADLGDVLDECKRACQMFELAITQNPSMSADGHLSVSTTLIHYRTGQWLTFPPLMMKMPNDAQAVGSALTYMRRYALLTVFGIAPEDDDGRAATQSARAPEQFGGYRSGAEQRIHEVIKALPQEQGKALRDSFRQQFGALSDLPVSKHGDALTWVLAWSPPDLNPNDDAGDLLRAQEVMEQAQLEPTPEPSAEAPNAG